jgi:TonB family protein
MADTEQYAGSLDGPLVWQPPGQQIRVVVDSRAAARMRDQALRRSADGSGFEPSEGLLLGSIERGRILTVPVEDIEPIAGSPGGRELEAALKARTADEAGRSVVGYYRTGLGNDSYLNTGDMALIRVCFPDPANVFFLLKPGLNDSLSSRLYFWQGGALRSAGSGDHPFGRPAQEAFGPVFPEAPEPTSRFREPPFAPRRLSRKRLWAAAAAAMTAVVLPLAAAHWYIARPPAPAQTEAAVPEVRPLALQVEKRPTDLILHWNGASPAVRAAERAVLHIRDGPFRRSYDLDLDQLRTGSVYYAPLGGDLEFRLEVFGRDGEPVVESVRVLSGGLLAAAALPPEPPAAARPAPPPAPRRQSAKPARKRSSRVLQPETLPRPRTVHYAYRDSDPPAGNITAPRPIRQVNPTVPAGAVRGSAEFGVRVSIDRTGRVTDARLVSQRGAASRLLADSALNAARMWRFEPALRGGRPVASNTVLNIRIAP